MMESLLPIDQETAQINEQRQQLADIMADSSPDTPLLLMAGPCSVDGNLLPNGELGTFVHLRGLQQAARQRRGIALMGRYVGAKPRSNTGPTGLLHEPFGPEIYARGATRLHMIRLPLIAEVMDESDAALALPHLTGAWSGSRNAPDTGPRYLMRPTSDELDAGIHPVPSFVKVGQDGQLDSAINALTAIMSDRPVTRTRLTLDGLQRVTTHANPHVGLILRGNDQRPDGPLGKILTEEIVDAQDRLQREFGDKKIPVIVDLSHAHAKWEGGGQKGQLAVLEGLGQAMMSGVTIDGIMAETYILPGKQPGDGTVPGLSLTDPCMDQASAERLVVTANKMHTYKQRALVNA